MVAVAVAVGVAVVVGVINIIGGNVSNYRIVSTAELGVGFPVVDFFDSRESADLALLFLAAGRHRETEPATAADLADPGHPWAIVPRAKAVL